MSNLRHKWGKNVWSVLTIYAGSGKFAFARHRYVFVEIICRVANALVAQYGRAPPW